MLPAPDGAPEPRVVRFGVYEFRFDTLTLSKYGLKIKLQEQPSRVLGLLLQNAGQIVTRESLKQELWPDSSFGEFDSGLNTALSKVRSALSDSGLRPTFIERVPRQGYRFIAPVLEASPAGPRLEPLPEPVPFREPAAPNRRLRPMPAGIIAGVFLLGTGVAVGLWVGSRQPAEAANHPVRFSIRLPAGQTLPLGTQGNLVSISTDGTTIGYLAMSGSTAQVFVKRFEEEEFRPVAATVGAVDFQLSPNGREVLFATENRWMRTTVTGGTASPVATVYAQQGALWAADGSIYVQDTEPRLNPLSKETVVYRIGSNARADVMTPRVPSVTEWLYARQVLPNGSLLLSQNAGPRDRSLLAISPRGGGRTLLLHSAMGGFWLPSGHLVYWWDGSLLAAPFSLSEMRVLGPGVPLVAGVAQQSWRGGQASVSSNGTLVYAPAPVGDRNLVWFDRDGNQAPLDVPPAPYTVLGLSRNGKRLLVHRTDAPHAGVWLYDLAERTWRRLAAGVWSSSSAVWSPDEQSVAFTASLQGEGFENLYVRPLNSTGTPERIAPSPYGQFATFWSERDGLIYTESDKPGTHIDVRRIRNVAGAAPEDLVTSTGDDSHASVSPDGRWLTWASNGSGRPEVYARLLGSPAPPIRLSRNGGSAPLWSPKGAEVFYRTRNALWSVRVAGDRFLEPQKLFEAELAGPRVWNHEYAVNADGTRFLFAKEVRDPDDYRRIQVVLNWTGEVARLVSGGSSRTQ
jgi:serine/threonine-protein kinase